MDGVSPAAGEGEAFPASAGSEAHRTFAGRPRIEPLTGLRWFAALAVYLHHFPIPDAPAWVERIFFNGYMGVTIFFVLSGFILAVSYGPALESPSIAGIWNFAVARFARVYPTYLLVLLFAAGLAVQQGGNLHHLLRHVLAVQAWSPNTNNQILFKFNAPGWSVGVEFFLYACFPVLIFALGRTFARSWVDCLLVAAVVVGASSVGVLFVHSRGLDGPGFPNTGYHWLYLTPAPRLGDFTLGICAGYLFMHFRHSPPAWWLTTALEIILVGAILAVMATPRVADSVASWDVIYAVPAAALLFLLAISPRAGLGRLLGHPSLVALGEASYAFYLIHYPLRTQLGATQSVLLNLFELALIVAAAWGIHVGFERPSRRLVRTALTFRIPAGKHVRPRRADDGQRKRHRRRSSPAELESYAEPPGNRVDDRALAPVAACAPALERIRERRRRPARRIVQMTHRTPARRSVLEDRKQLLRDDRVVVSPRRGLFEEGKAGAEPLLESDSGGQRALGLRQVGAHIAGELGGVLLPVRIRRGHGPLAGQRAESVERRRLAKDLLEPGTRSGSPRGRIGKHMAVLVGELVGEPGPEVAAYVEPDDRSARGIRTSQRNRRLRLVGGRLDDDPGRGRLIASRKRADDGHGDGRHVVRQRAAPVTPDDDGWPGAHACPSAVAAS